ncbi:DUF805 domain-containing protein [Kocuria marina]|uniref:DUF805 domain-containing protein n=1 Tax=Kocuria TaxID=57493 RepID=UPI0009ED9B54|nr:MULTISPECIES: DUF805 domain-containing protein [Kocuria]MCT1722084.1 DUF805 domain-containing protein [Kocuria marina]MCT1735390.1 DUF805 domain-containing protein [Kocuria marina]
MTCPAQPLPRSTQPGESVGPLRAIGNFLRKGTTFSGRASRSEYWWIALYSFLFSVAYNFAQDRGYLDWPDVDGGASVALMLLALVTLLVSVLLFIFAIALSVRRLHDINASGLWFMLFLIPGLGTLALLILAALPPNPRGVRFDNQTIPNGTPAAAHDRGNVTYERPIARELRPDKEDNQ